MPGLDLKKEHPEAYRAKKQVEEVKLGPAHCICLDGKGEPGGPAFQAAIGALFGTAYGVKFAAKRAGNDFVVPPLECLYWAYDESSQRMLAPGEWKWRLMIRMPPGTTNAQVDRAKDAVARKHGDVPVGNVRFERIHEGRAVQILHIGPYDQEQEAGEALGAYMESHGLRRNGPHHEVYLSDPSRTAPDKLKTIIRYPVA